MNPHGMAYVQGKAVSILGVARSGMAAAALLSRHGANVFVSEYGTISEEKKRELSNLGVAWEDGGHTAKAVDSDFVVVSPGVPSASPPMVSAMKSKTPIFSEIEVASWFCNAPIIAITGSNGKTTTTELMGHIFKKSGRTTWVCGNVGTPFSGICDQCEPADIIILEVSSFQLDHIDQFKPTVSVLLNITPDHLDRYEYVFERYAESKMRICENQRADCAVVFNVDDTYLRERMRKAALNGPEQFTISINGPVDKGGYFDRDTLFIATDRQSEKIMYVDELALRGRHNVYNSLAAAVAARVMEVRSDVVRESLRTFAGVPHRLETIREVDGVRYINDSKATNVNAVWFALESFSEPVVLIAGGRDKGNDYSSLKPLITSRVRALITIGEAAEKMHEELGPCVPDCVAAESLEDAVKLAQLLAKPGDVVLLSPACASFDMFDSYEHRGDLFKQAVSNL
jgi:UDP-N-acetylmuramoylalanine--D-glutamate ligase